MTVLEQYLEIARQLPGYEPRPVQEAMVSAVGDALTHGEHLVIEAGTGAGKSFGYLVPALLSSRRPIVVSTGTIALQEQLLNKDIPFVASAAGMKDLQVSLVKGRRNYLCLQKLTEFERTLGPAAPEKLYVQWVLGALDQGWDGDRATLDMEMPPEIWEEMQSDSEDCLGKRCAYYQDNPFRLAREAAREADILIVNHALYLQDLSSGQSLLPPHDVVIVDEAHQFRSFSLSALTSRIGKYMTQKLLRKIHRRLQPVPESYHEAIYHTESMLLEWLFRIGKSTFTIHADGEFLALAARQAVVLQELRTWLSDFDVKQLPIIETELDIDRAQLQRQKLLGQLDGLIGSWEYFCKPDSPDRVNWAEVRQDRLYYELKSTPLDIASQLKNSLWDKRAGILTSATLATDRNLGAFRRDLGLAAPAPKVPDRVLDSPFDFALQSQLYLPQHLPEPNDPSFTMAAAAEIARLLHASEGRAFVLCTSYAAMRALSTAVIPNITYPCKLQGDMPKNRLVSWFKETPGSVLFATATFWEGIDIPGEDLSCVIIDRIPFANPDDPVHSAVVNRLKRQGQDWFNGYALPEAAIRLKQGVGRLIRSRQDRGLIAILDARLHTKGYGPKLLRSLPTMPIIHRIADIRVFDADLLTDMPLQSAAG